VSDNAKQNAEHIAKPDDKRLAEWDYAYSETNDYFGEQPTPILCDYHDQLDPTRPVLDIGTGQGRNAVFLARAGVAVDAVDPSAVAIELVADRAAQEGLPVRCTQCGIEDFKPDVASYGGVLCFGLIQILPWESIAMLLANIDRWTTPGSLVFLTAWTKQDPSYARCTARWQAIGRHSFDNGEGVVRTYLEENQILDLFPGYAVVHHWEGLGPAHRHGDGPLERHGHIDAVLRKSTA